MTISRRFLKSIRTGMTAMILVAMLVMFSAPALAVTVTFDLEKSSEEELISIRDMINDRLAEFDEVTEETNANALEEEAFAWSSTYRKGQLPTLKEGIPLLKNYFKNPNSVEILSVHGRTIYDDDGNTAIGGDYVFEILAENSFGGSSKKKYACTYYIGSEEWSISDDPASIRLAGILGSDFEAADVEWINSLLK